jgi:hypothetical protein
MYRSVDGKGDWLLSDQPIAELASKLIRSQILLTPVGPTASARIKIQIQERARFGNLLRASRRPHIDCVNLRIGR